MQIITGATGSNSSHLKSHLEHKHPDIFNRTKVESVTLLIVDEAQLEYCLIKKIAGLALPLSIVENVRQDNPTIPQIFKMFD